MSIWVYETPFRGFRCLPLPSPRLWNHQSKPESAENPGLMSLSPLSPDLGKSLSLLATMASRVKSGKTPFTGMV